MSDAHAAKSPRHSLTTMTEIVLPQHANALGTVFGGQVMAWIDICGAIAAHRHCGRIAVTVSVDELVFLEPIHVGDIVCLDSRVNAVFGSSLEVRVIVDVQDPMSLDRRRCVESFLTFVSVKDGRPSKAPPLLLETAEDRSCDRSARERRAERLAHRNK